MGMGNGEWGMGNGEWGMGNWEWGTCTERLVPTCTECSRSSGAEVSRSIRNRQEVTKVY